MSPVITIYIKCEARSECRDTVGDRQDDQVLAPPPPPPLPPPRTLSGN